VLNKIAAVIFVGLILGKLFFRRQLRAFGKRLDGLVNAILISIAVLYSIQLVLWLTGRR
jgi:hypothetical protein